MKYSGRVGGGKNVIVIIIVRVHDESPDYTVSYIHKTMIINYYGKLHKLTNL